MITVKVEGVEKALKAITKYRDDVQKRGAAEVNAGMLEVRNEAIQNTPVNHGRLRSSIRLDKMGASRPYSEVYTNVQYAPFVEFGTKSKVEVPAGLEDYAMQFKSGGGSFDDLLKNIEAWAVKKGIPKQMAYPIARKIAREGIEPQPFLFPAWETHWPQIVKRLERILLNP